MSTEKRDGLLTEDNSEIKLVPEGRRAVWFRPARPDYWCGDCGVQHRVTSKIGERHNPRAKR